MTHPERVTQNLVCSVFRINLRLGRLYQRAKGYIHRVIVTKSFSDIWLKQNNIGAGAEPLRISSSDSAFHLGEVILGP